MKYAVILAGGSGSRMGNTERPKQFLMLGDKPILIHTLEQFYVHPEIDKIVICINPEWLHYAEDLISKYLPNTENIDIVEGGETRADSLMNGCYHIKEKYGLKKDDIIVSHDAVTPFLTQKMITDNIELCLKYGATDTVYPAVETIVQSKDGKFITEIPIRKEMYYGQNPQAFNIQKLIKLFESLTEKEKQTLTDGCKIFTTKGEKVALVNGKDYNIKITTLYNLKVANAILETGVNHD